MTIILPSSPSGSLQPSCSKNTSPRLSRPRSLPPSMPISAIFFYLMICARINVCDRFGSCSLPCAVSCSSDWQDPPTHCLVLLPRNCPPERLHGRTEHQNILLAGQGSRYRRLWSHLRWKMQNIVWTMRQYPGCPHGLLDSRLHVDNTMNFILWLRSDIGYLSQRSRGSTVPDIWVDCSWSESIRHPAATHKLL